jgi:hypothetical protein
MNRTFVVAITIVAAVAGTAVAQPAVIVSVARETGINRSWCGPYSVRSDTVGAWNWDSLDRPELDCLFNNFRARQVSEVWPWAMDVSMEVSGGTGNMYSWGSGQSSFDVTFEISNITFFDLHAVWSTSTSDSGWLSGPDCYVRLERLLSDPMTYVESRRRVEGWEDWCCNEANQDCCRRICAPCEADVRFRSSLPPGRYRLQANASAGATGERYGGSSATLALSLFLWSWPDHGCIADFNRDGGVDGLDIQAFFDPWTSGETVADVNSDGGVDGQDLFHFFDRWSQGC